MAPNRYRKALLCRIMGPSRSVTLAGCLTSPASVTRAGRYRGSQANREAAAIGDTNWRSMFEIYPSTIRMGGLCFNLVLRAILVGLVWTIALVIGFALNWLIDQMLGLIGAGAYPKEVSRQIVLAFVITLSAIATLTSLWDMLKFAWLLTKSPMPESSEKGERKPRD